MQGAILTSMIIGLLIGSAIGGLILWLLAKNVGKISNATFGNSFLVCLISSAINFAIWYLMGTDAFRMGFAGIFVINLILSDSKRSLTYLKEIINTQNKKALIIGAGGVSPSVIFSLQKSKIQDISITNRTQEKLIFLKKNFNFLKIIEWESLEKNLDKFDIIINATSLGLKNGSDFQFNFNNVKKNLIYIDTIYNPLETKTLKFLKKNDIKTFNGLDMFVYQGQKSFYLWNKVNPEIDDELIELLKSNL